MSYTIPYWILFWCSVILFFMNTYYNNHLAMLLIWVGLALSIIGLGWNRGLE